MMSSYLFENSTSIEKVYLEATGHKIKTYFLLGEPHWIIFNPGVMEA